MNKTLLVAFAILLLSISAYSQTNVSGNITQNTTWTKANSPYVLVGNVGVPGSYTLTIEPGVEVQRSGDYQIFIIGAIQFNGAVSDSIVFTSPASLDYTSRYFIEFQKSDLSRSSLRFIVLQNNGGTNNFLRLGNEDENNQSPVKNTGQLSISRSHFDHGYVETKGYRTTASLRIDSSLITTCHLDEINSYGEPISVFNTSLYNSYLPINGYGNGTSYTNCYLNGNDMMVSCCGAVLSVVNSTIENSKMNDFFGQSIEDSLVFINSTLINTPISATSANVSLINSNISYTQKVYNRDGSESKTMVSAGVAILKNCNLQNSSAEAISGLNITGQSLYSTTDTVLRSRFTNLYDAVRIDNFSSIKLDSNNFFTPGRYDIVNNSTKDFYALYNYFELQNAQTIDNLIYDQNDDLSLGLVIYIPNSGDSLVLPLKLISFTGNKEGTAIKLSWQTSNEINVSNFIIQKKAGSGYTNIGTVASAGKSNEASYSFTDASPVAGTNYYRLKITDKDGKYAYSPVVPVVFDNVLKAWRVYPNPASTYIVVEYNVYDNNAQLQLINAGGSVVKTKMLIKGSTQATMNVNGVAKGTYKLVVKDGSHTESKTVVIQ